MHYCLLIDLDTSGRRAPASITEKCDETATKHAADANVNNLSTSGKHLFASPN